MSIFSGLATGIVGGAVSAFGTVRANRAAAAAAANQMAFQERSMRHRYQWTVEDMRKAGINPMVAYQQGGGGSLGGASYQPQSVTGQVANSAANALAAAKLKEEIRLTRKSADNKQHQSHLYAQHIAESAQRERLIKEQIHSAKAAAAGAKIEEDILQTRFGKALRWLDLTGRSLWPGASTGRKIAGN